MNEEDQALVDSVRLLAGPLSGGGPDDVHILAGVRGFAEAFNYWYIRVVRQAAPQYRQLIIGRINPFIRRVELDGLDATQAANRLVEDYVRRNFVTAGGWALEELAIAASETMQKSAAEGIDAQRMDPGTSAYHLYILKSGLVTRNSDIVRSIKSHGRQAEKLLRQGRGTGGVNLNYAILAGKTASSFEDGVRRPSSAEFWSESLGLPEAEALELALAMAAEAGRLVTRDASSHIEALETLVRTYIAQPDGSVDWDFIAKRNMQTPANWRAEDRGRHEAAEASLVATGYVMASEEDAEAVAIAVRVAGLEPSHDDLAN